MTRWTRKWKSRKARKREEGLVVRDQESKERLLIPDS
jgi:hypothetical protein